jgi:hypothetical protein
VEGMTLFGTSIEALNNNHFCRDGMGMKLQQISESPNIRQTISPKSTVTCRGATSKGSG